MLQFRLYSMLESFGFSSHPRSEDNSSKITRRFSRPVTDSSRVLRLCQPSAGVRKIIGEREAQLFFFFHYNRSICIREVIVIVICRTNINFFEEDQNTQKKYLMNI